MEGEILRASRRGVRGTWWRGQRMPEGETPRASDFGPTLREGRFNRRGEPALYLARTLRAVAAECRATKERPALWVRRFDLDLPGVRVLSRPASGALFGAWAAADERASAEEDYALSHALADAARRAGVEAVLYASDESPEEGDVNLALLGEAARLAAGMAVGDPERG